MSSYDVTGANTDLRSPTVDPKHKGKQGSSPALHAYRAPESPLHPYPETKELFDNSRVLGAYRRDTNLRDSLVRSSLQSGANTGDEPHGTFPCHRPRCRTCAHANPASQINTPGGPLTIRQRFSCTTSNIVYIITCRACTMSYIGETGRRLGDRFCEHLRSVERKADLPVAKHFSSPGHTTDDMMVSVVRSGLTNIRERRSAEGRLIFKCRTLQPRGINIDFAFI
ncbi:hypothetical protein ACROYT_G013937 [Oculina patagonica]